MRLASIRTIAPAIVAAIALIGTGSPAAASVEIEVSVESGGNTLCSGLTAPDSHCDVTGLGAATISVTWSLSTAAGPAQESVNGYDLNLAWDPAVLTLLSSSQLFPDSGPPDTIPFLLAPGSPAGSHVLVISPVAFTTTALLSADFQIIPKPASDCLIDLSWSANGNGLSPATLILNNPAGATIDIGLISQCSDGLENDTDGFIDFDGGACAGVFPPTLPDPQCGTPIRNKERPGCGLGVELALFLPFLWRRRRVA